MNGLAQSRYSSGAADKYSHHNALLVLVNAKAYTLAGLPLVLAYRARAIALRVAPERESHLPEGNDDMANNKPGEHRKIDYEKRPLALPVWFRVLIC